MLETLQSYALDAQRIALDWLTSPAAISQFALLILSYAIALGLNRRLQPLLQRVLDPGEAQTTFAKARRFALMFLPLLLPLLAYGLTAIGEQATRSIFGSGAVIAFGKRVFIFLAVRQIVQHILTDSFLRLLGKYVFIPLAAIYVVGLLGTVELWAAETRVGVGNIQMPILGIFQAVVFGGLLFWLGRWSSDTGTGYIRAQEEMRPPTRELAAKAFEMAVFAIAALLLFNILGLDLSALALLSGAVGVGLGFGLQKIASNFISGIILLLEGQATVGDYVELDGGEAGTIIKMMMRATILETFDGKWIVVPNEDFITSRIVNWSDAGSGNRYEAAFSVSYDTDIMRVPPIIEAAVATHPGVLTAPEPPDCELRGFGDSGIDFAVEFWVEGIDDGKNRFTSDVLFLIWKALKDNDIEIPFPQRELRVRGGGPLMAVVQKDS
ncbi:MAG: mechanosensitive ion channel domain-containing protein [Pseudomonadota bacterium]